MAGRQYDHNKSKKPLATRSTMIQYSKKLAEYICGEICKGRTLTSICKEEGIPSHTTVHKWVREDNEKKAWFGFKEMYNTAREIQLNWLIDQMHDIADMPPPVPPSRVKNEHGEMIPLEGVDRKLWVNAENQRRRLKVDAIKFQTAKLAGALGQQAEKGIVVQGDTINILQYSTDKPLDFQKKPDENITIKETNFLEVPKESQSE